MTRTASLPVVALHLLAAARWWREPPVAETTLRRTAVSPTDGFDGCVAGALALWRDERAAAVCFPHGTTPIGAPPMRLSPQTITADDADVDEIAPPVPLCPGQHPLVPPLGLTDGLRPGPVGESQRLHRKTRRHRRHCVRCRPQNDDGDLWATVLPAAVFGLCVGVDPAAAWACGSVAVGLYWLAADRHFWRPVCAALSLNFWFATAWITWTVSPKIGAALALAALAFRDSGLLFPADVLEGDSDRQHTFRVPSEDPPPPYPDLLMKAARETLKSGTTWNKTPNDPANDNQIQFTGLCPT